MFSNITPYHSVDKEMIIHDFAYFLCFISLKLPSLLLIVRLSTHFNLFTLPHYSYLPNTHLFHFDSQVYRI
jgi:hypothetical protein